MRKKYFMVGVGLAVGAIAFWFCLLLSSTPVPVYGGRNLTDWLQELTPNNSAEVQSRATSAVRTIGTNAIPLLIDYLSLDDHSISMDTFRSIWVRRFGGRRPLDPLERRNQAVFGFRALGPLSQPAVPKLKKLMNRDELRDDAARAYGASGLEEALPFLATYLENPDPNKRCAGAAGLAEMKERARPSVPKLIQLVTEDKDAEVRVAAADALGMIGPPDTSIPVLVKTLRGDSSPSVRMCAVFALSKFPSYPNVVEEVHRVAQQDESAKVRECADSALRRLKDSDRSGEYWNLLGPK